MEIIHKQIIFSVYLLISKKEDWQKSVKKLRKQMSEKGYKPYYGRVNCWVYEPEDIFPNGKSGAPFEFIKKKIEPFYPED